MLFYSLRTPLPTGVVQAGTALLLPGLMLCTGLARADQVRLAWDSVEDTRVAAYEVHIGQASRDYDRSVASTTNEALIDDLAAGGTYFFAVRACTADRSLCSPLSNEVSTTLDAGPRPPTPAPRAAFATSRTRGAVPLTVLFTDQSAGSITRRSWSLGDGTTSSAVDVVHTYTAPGSYSVRLAVAGPGGEDQELKADWIDALPARVPDPEDSDDDPIDDIGPHPHLLLAEDFTDFDSVDWSVVDEGTRQAPSDWRIEAGELAQFSNVHSPAFGDFDLPAYGTYLRFEHGFGWTDYRVSYRQRAADDDALGLMFRFVDAENYYRFSWHQQGGYRRLVKAVDGVFTELAADAVAYEQDRDYQVQIVTSGEQIEVWIDGALVFQVHDDAHFGGSIAFYTEAMEGAYFDDLLVEDLRSLLAEDFTDFDPIGWSVIDEGTDQPASDWRIAAGELAQLSNIHTRFSDSSDLSRDGTYMLYQDGFGWRDYRVSYRQRAADDDATGLMFRVADAENYYRFSWDRQRGYRRLIKAVDGVFTELAADDVVYEQDQDYQIQIVTSGEQIEVWIDGGLVFEVNDGAHPGGSIAFYTWAMEGAYFDDLLVQALGD